MILRPVQGPNSGGGSTPLVPGAAPADPGDVAAPVTGTLSLWQAEEGAEVAQGQVIAVVEAMKMEHVLTAPVDGTVRELRARPGGTVAKDAVLLVVEAPDEEESA